MTITIRSKKDGCGGLSSTTAILYSVLSIIDAIQQLLCAEIKIFDTFRLLTIIPRVFLFE